MKVRNRTDFPFAPLLGRVNYPNYAVTCTVKGTFALKPGGVLEPLDEQPQFEGDVPSEAERPECLYAADLVPYKPKADLLLRAECHTPGGKGVTACPVIFSVGQWSKELAVIGNRKWEKSLVFSKMTEPEVFNRVELTWGNAFGGEKFALNPAGKGRKDGLLPNVEYPDELVKSAGNQPTPASFGPIDRTWKQRASKLGTYDKKWQKERWPAYPKDLDWTHFNAAAEDQQVPFLRGDESFALTNMHPEHPSLKGELPSLRVRCIARLKPEQGEDLLVRDVAMNLDTLYIDVPKMQVTLVWRGVCDIREEEGEDVADVLVFSEPLADSPATIQQVMPWFEEEPDEADALPPEPPLVVDTGVMEGDALAGAIEAMANQTVGQLNTMSPVALSMAPAAFEGFGQMRSALAGIASRLKAAGQPVPPSLSQVMSDFDNDPDLKDGESDLMVAQALALLPAATALSGAKLAGKIRSGEAPHRDFAGVDMAGEDLSGSDLSQADFTGANLAGTVFTGCKLDGALFSSANLAGANLAGVKAEQVDFTAANLEGADLTGAGFPQCSFDQVKATGIKLGKAELPGATFADADLVNAEAGEAQLKQADLSRADLTGANFEKADLAEATLNYVKADGVKFKQCKGASLRGAEANFKGADFEEAELPGAIFENANLEEANFRFAMLKRALFANANLSKAVLFGAVVRGGSLRKANMAGAQAGNADFFECDFEKSNLKGASLITSNCYGAAFRDADTSGADLTETNLKQTLLA